MTHTLSTSVSALIPHYGDPEPTLRLIEQLRAQVGLTALEIIVSDDHSPIPFPQGDGYRVLRRSHNGGFGSSVNTAAAAATTDLLLVLNSDLTISTDFIASLVQETRKTPPSVAGPMVVENNLPIFSARKWPAIRHQVVEWLTPLARFRTSCWWHRMVGHDLSAHRAAGNHSVDWLMGACLLIPRDAFERVGGFDERFFMNSEEIDIQRRLTALGVPSVLVPQVRVDHEGGGSSDPSRRRGWLVDARFVYAEKWGGAAMLRRSLKFATEINYLWNLTRELRGVPGVDASSTRRFEHSLIDHGWATRRGQGPS